MLEIPKKDIRVYTHILLFHLSNKKVTHEHLNNHSWINLPVSLSNGNILIVSIKIKR